MTVGSGAQTPPASIRSARPVASWAQASSSAYSADEQAASRVKRGPPSPRAAATTWAGSPPGPEVVGLGEMRGGGRGRACGGAAAAGRAPLTGRAAVRRHGRAAVLRQERQPGLGEARRRESLGHGGVHSFPAVPAGGRGGERVVPEHHPGPPAFGPAGRGSEGDTPASARASSAVRSAQWNERSQSGRMRRRAAAARRGRASLGLGAEEPAARAVDAVPVPVLPRAQARGRADRVCPKIRSPPSVRESAPSIRLRQ
ncbi:hypothetical protein SGLAM104S_09182 [Streptomyces glaucescens]